MMLRNLLVGLPVMLLCLVVQVAFAFWGVRYFVRQSATATAAPGAIVGIRPLLVVMLVMMLGTSCRSRYGECCSSCSASSRSCTRRSTTRR